MSRLRSTSGHLLAFLSQTALHPTRESTQNGSRRPNSRYYYHSCSGPPYLLKAGEKAAEEAGKKIGGDTWEWAKDLWSRLRPKVEAKPAALQATNEVALAPNDAGLQATLRVQLKKLLTEDQTLTEEVGEWFERAKAAGVIAVASGERSAAIGGDVGGSNIITGDRNVGVADSKIDGDVGRDQTGYRVL